ncbi:MAG: hypothetical protein ABI665_25380 [Vicinamibacterales bacterium]
MPPLVAGALDAVVDSTGSDAGRDSAIGARGAGRDDAREAAVGALEIDGVRRAGATGGEIVWGAGVDGEITPSDSVTAFGAAEAGASAGLELAADEALAVPAGRS